MVRTRIAPSPTGFPHIGTVYQALFDYAYAKKNRGAFIVRIEDTDQSRFVEGAEEKIYQALDWFSLYEDESPRKGGKYSPYRQSERLQVYRDYAEELISKGHAYYCTCSKERLDKVRQKMLLEKKPPMYDGCCREKKITKEYCEKNSIPYVIRMKVPKNIIIKTVDEIRGVTNYDSNVIDDQVIIKSDGYPTYHLAVVVDDHLMEISHMVRGEDWLPSAPKQFLLYKMFGWKPPLFYHTVNLRNPDKKKMSKRHGHSNVDWYKEEGFLPEAVLNYLALLGWSHPDKIEFFSLNDFISVFDLRDIRATPPIFDLVKLTWMNGEYIRKMKPGELARKIYAFFNGKYSKELIIKTIPLIQERIKTLKEYDYYCSFFTQAPTEYEIDLRPYKETLIAMRICISENGSLEGLAEKLHMKNREFFMVLRVAITGKKITPPLNESMEILGKEEVLSRLTLAAS